MAEAKFQALVDVMTRLRDPQNGCPWDREQTHDTLKPFLIEEAYEVIEAIENLDDVELRGELGDLLLQVVFHAQLAKERSAFTIDDVVEAITQKMVRRHPHVFGEEKVSGAEDVLRNWETIKAAEREAAGKNDPVATEPEAPSILAGVSSRVPALIEATQLTERAARVGFDWPGVAEVLEKLNEELEELQAVIAQPVPDPDELEDEIGDLLFAVVNIARLLKVEPESALRRTNRKFKRRFRHIEQSLHDQGKSIDESNLDEMEQFWQEAKRRERQNPPIG